MKGQAETIHNDLNQIDAERYRKLKTLPYIELYHWVLRLGLESDFDAAVDRLPDSRNPGKSRKKNRIFARLRSM